jgi:hypothetical protein
LEYYRKFKEKVHATGLKWSVSVSTKGNFANAVESIKRPVAGMPEKESGAKLGILAASAFQVWERIPAACVVA